MPTGDNRVDIKTGLDQSTDILSARDSLHLFPITASTASLTNPD